MDHYADRFIEGIRAEVLDSAAVNHPYLIALNTGEFPDVQWALQDFAFQYGLYNARFTHYVSAVIGNLRDPAHKQIMLANLAEEHGDTEGVDLSAEVMASIAGLPHASLYQRFQQALGVDGDYIQKAQRCSASLIWTRQFEQLCALNEGAGVGAIGIGTELIVSRIYAQILGGLQAHSRLTPRERVFFDLHSQCDDEHAAQILLIARDLAQDAGVRQQLEYGARTAIEMRIAFWDAMLERAQSLPAADASLTTERANGAN